MGTGEGGGENFQLPSAIENLPKNVFLHGCLLRNENGRCSRERSTSMNARVWGRRPTENKENPWPATSRHAYNYTERDKKSAPRCTMCEVGPLWIGCPPVCLLKCVTCTWVCQRSGERLVGFLENARKAGLGMRPAKPVSNSLFGSPPKVLESWIFTHPVVVWSVFSGK